MCNVEQCAKNRGGQRSLHAAHAAAAGWGCSSQHLQLPPLLTHCSSSRTSRPTLPPVQPLLAMAAQLERQAAAAVAEAAEEAADELEEFSVSGQAPLQGRVLLESAGRLPRGLPFSEAGSLCALGGWKVAAAPPALPELAVTVAAAAAAAAAPAAAAV